LSNSPVLDYLPAAGGLGQGARHGAARRSNDMAAQRTDRELVDAARGGEAAAFGEFVRRHQKRVFRLAVHLLRNTAEAEDVSQEAFVRAYGALARFDGRSEPFTWLYRITVNLSLNAIRSRKTGRSAGTTDDPRIEAALVERRPGLADPGRQATDRELARALCDGVDSLSETLRTTLVLVAVDGLSHAEVSQVLGCPEGTVAWRVHEARKKLKEFLESRGHGPDPESHR
jgi:RNA polymerase sigma-70 factor, ECF subfamily